MIAIHDKRYSEYQRYIQTLIDKGEIGIETYKKPIAKSGQQNRRERRKLNKK
jgi:hypothetical protein